MIFLQALNSTFTTVTVLYRLDTLYSSECTGDCCDVRNLVLQTDLADCLSVFGVVALGFWCVDYQADILVHNQVIYIRAAGTDFVNQVALYAVCVVEISSSLCCNQSKAKIFQSFSDFKNFFFCPSLFEREIRTFLFSQAADA